MHCPSGEIVQLNDEDAIAMLRDRPLELMPIPSDELEEVKEMNKPKRKNWMRNKPCPCKSGKKFKKCCWGKLA